jgi:putative ABC transport system substrate-binding protein
MRFDHLRRRDFIALLGGGAASWPLAARAQQPTLPVIGLLGTQSRELWEERLGAFRRGLAEAGYVEGRTVAMEYRFVDDAKAQLSVLAADLVARRVNVIAAFGGPQPAVAAKAVTASIPIVFTLSGDPVESGLVDSLSHPGRNLTGATTLNIEVSAKRLELMHELIPAATVIALLVDPGAADPQLAELNSAARTLGLQLGVLHAGNDRELDDAFATLAQLGAGGLVIGVSSFLISRSSRLAALALRYRVPSVYLYREFAVAGGLMSYGGSLAEGYRMAGSSAGRILQGAKPAELPVQQATKVELIINLKTAKALGLDVPVSLLARADEVIE